jgi:ABC-type lipopolysaccharide export system ATPase subunit
MTFSNFRTSTQGRAILITDHNVRDLNIVDCAYHEGAGKPGNERLFERSDQS